jgi:hypothetical protein
MPKKMRWALIAPVFVVGMALAQTVLDNDGIVKMVKAGLGDDVIVSMIDAQPGNYTVTPDAMVQLKQDGVSDKVLSAMIAKFSSASASSAPETAPSPGSAPTPAAAAAPAQPALATGPSATAPDQPASANAPAGNRQAPRVFLQSASNGNTWNSRRDQSMEMSKDFQKTCPGIIVTINQQMADYTLILSHIELGAWARDNQLQVADKTGDLLKTKEGGSIKGNVKTMCNLILSDWARQQATISTGGK